MTEVKIYETVYNGIDDDPELDPNFIVPYDPDMFKDAPLPKTLNIIYTEYTNTKGDLNKTFSLDKNGNVVKTSNAFMSEGKAKVQRLTDLTSFDRWINHLKPNQAIGLGIPIDYITEATICKKGEEDITTKTISRTKEYQKWSKGRSLCLFDYDPDDAMHDALKINSADELRELLIRVIPDLVDVEMIIRPGSSYGVKNKSGECVSCKQSYHVYFEILLDGAEDIKNLVEYFLRSSVVQGLHYLKIFKDARSELRTAIDLSVLKSAESRLIFEAAPSCKDGLYQERGVTKFYNQDSCEALDIKKLNYKFLPNWKEEQNRLREYFKNKIIEVKKEYKEKQIQKFIVNGLSKKEALEKFKLTYENLLMPADEIVTLNDGTQQSILQLILSNNTSVYTKDVYEPQKGTSKAIISPKYIFDATYYTYLRGGMKYSIYYTYEHIEHILTVLIKEYEEKDYHKVIQALVMYCVNNNIAEYNVKKIDDFLTKKGNSDNFYQKFINKDIEVKSMKKLKDHAMLVFGGKVGIIDTTQLELNDYSKSGKKDEYANEKIHTKNPVEVWLEHKDRKKYTEIVFQPDGKCLPHQYNVFKGFPYEPKRNDEILSPFCDLVRNVICNSDDFMYGLVWSWMANIIQEPASKAGTALVLRGEQGVGKGTFATIFGQLLKDYYLETSENDRIFGKFNAHLSNRLVVYLNEAFWSGDKVNEGKLKNLITDIHFTYEIKQGAVFTGKNYTHLIIDSNDDYVVPDGPNERRYINLDVSSCRKGNDEYFESLYALAENKEFLQALMYALSTFDYSGYMKHLRRAPKTAMSVEQALYNLEPMAEWWYNCLCEGSIGDDFSLEAEDDRSIVVANEDLFKSYEKYMRGKGKTVHKSNSAFGQYFNGKVISKHLVYNKSATTKLTKKNAKHIASLDKCREDFIKKFKIFEIESGISEWKIVDIRIPRTIG